MEMPEPPTSKPDGKPENGKTPLISTTGKPSGKPNSVKDSMASTFSSSKLFLICSFLVVLAIHKHY